MRQTSLSLPLVFLMLLEALCQPLGAGALVPLSRVAQASPAEMPDSGRYSYDSGRYSYDSGIGVTRSLGAGLWGPLSPAEPGLCCPSWSPGHGSLLWAPHLVLKVTPSTSTG